MRCAHNGALPQRAVPPSHHVLGTERVSRSKPEIKMKRISILTAVACLLAVTALPAHAARYGLGSGAPVEPYGGNYSAENGGYVVNRYGFGNYVGGAGGGFAGYPAGSAGAQIYKQRQERKCVYAPERC